MNPITTQKANCKDCHRCVRSCPVKAIGIEKGHARLLDNKCILCGRCVVECPQHAKQIESDLANVIQAVTDGRKVILSLAPSFISAFPEYTWEELKDAVLKLGFTVVEETALGASIVADNYKSFLTTRDHPLISACCPVVVRIITTYYPELTKDLAGVVSPMVAHGQICKHDYGKEALVVFAGPCIAKIAEARENPTAIDAVITFRELKSWLEKNRVDNKATVHNAKRDGETYRARYFPIPGGIVKSFMDPVELEHSIVCVDGIENCIEVFDGIVKGEINPQFVEALACNGGCIGGPAGSDEQCMAARRIKVMEFAKNADKPSIHYPGIDFSRLHKTRPVSDRQPTQEQIHEILRKTGKYTVLDEKNCGACGYNSCREKAVAVFQGIAETEMCVPYMRTKAESFANIIVDHSLNGIIVVDHNMMIVEFNPTAQRLFNMREDMARGQTLAQIMDCSDFMHALATGDKITGKRVEYPHLGVITEQMIIPVREHGIIIAIVTDVTSEEKRAKELQHMKLETAEKATEIIKKQMHVAQEIAGLLGETTAETKAALLELVWLLKDKEDK